VGVAQNSNWLKTRTDTVVSDFRDEISGASEAPRAHIYALLSFINITLLQSARQYSLSGWKCFCLVYRGSPRDEPNGVTSHLNTKTASPLEVVEPHTIAIIAIFFSGGLYRA
jgi:hypothetical protein